MNEHDKNKWQKKLDEVRGDVDRADQRRAALIRLSSAIKGLAYGVFIGTGVGLGGGMGAVRGEVNIGEAISGEPLGQEARDWLEKAVAAEESDPFGKDQMTLRCALATPIFALQGMLLGLAVGTGVGTLRSVKRKK